MTVAQINDLMYQFFIATVQLSMPILLISMLIGVLISILQAATQVHEQTLTFVPKLIVIGLLLLAFGSRMMEILQDFVEYIFSLIAMG